MAGISRNHLKKREPGIPYGNFSQLAVEYTSYIELNDKLHGHGFQEAKFTVSGIPCSDRV